MFYEWGVFYGIMVPVVYAYRHRKGMCTKSPDTDVSVTAAMVWPVTLVVDAVYGPEK
jgi:hypothetical protein